MNCWAKDWCVKDFNDWFREKLNDLYERIFLKRAEKVLASDRRKGFAPYIDDKEAFVILTLLKHKQWKCETNLITSYKRLVIQTLVKKDCSDLSRKGKEETAKEKLNKILESEFFANKMQRIKTIYDRYYNQKDVFADHLDEYCCGAESVFEHLNSNEVELWNYLYELRKNYMEKYADKKDPTHYDISLKENQGVWEILTKEERNKLAKLVMALKDKQGTFLKYIRCGSIYGMLPEDNLYLLVSDISGHSHYISFVRTQHITRMIQHMPDYESLLDPKTEKLYEDLKYRIKKADEICSKIEGFINKKLDDEYDREIEKAAKKKQKNK